jgi:hypothetical protein
MSVDVAQKYVKDDGFLLSSKKKTRFCVPPAKKNSLIGTTFLVFGGSHEKLIAGMR